MLVVSCSLSNLCASSEAALNTTISIPNNSHLILCKDSSLCFDAADAVCAHQQNASKWHQVPENGNVFPALIQNQDKSWRLTIVCD